MSATDRPLRVGQRVKVAGKDVKGTVSYFGYPTFATGKWVGVILDEPKGKNNGTIRGHAYFACEENYGMFVRTSQLVMLDEDGNPLEMTATTPEEVKGSRSRLSSSRHSLAGSRQSLSNMSVQSPNERASTPDSTIKRASFVETNFVETLNPQFTPGQSITSPINQLNVQPMGPSAEEKLAYLQSQQEIVNLKAQVEDLTEKLDTLRVKRLEEREKLKELERLRMQLDQMTEFKSRIMESQASLQRDVQRAKQEAREAIAARDVHAEEMAELSETVEMATLDREMAEEKAETLQMELDASRERLEEALLDLQLLRAELDGGTAGMKESSGGTSTYELKQLEQQNARLRDTLVRLRDLSAHEKHHMQKMQKDLDQKRSEIAELGRTKEKLSSRVEELETQIADLQEQVDAALGAEEMVEQLGEKKMALEDEVIQLKEEVSELEALQEVHEQLVESNHELEMDLREELEMAHASTREAIREREAALENIFDKDLTISKFRELVQRLNEQCTDYRNRLNEKDNKTGGVEVRTVTEQQLELVNQAGGRAGTKAVDLQLRALQLRQAAEHAAMLQAYMPDHLMLRGGDHDAILTLLLLPRMICKADILLSQIRDKFPTVLHVDREQLVKSHAAVQYSYRCKMQHHLHMLLTILQQYAQGIATCTPDILLKVAGALPELSLQERPLDAALELLKTDRLDENCSTEGLEKSYMYFMTMLPILLGCGGPGATGSRPAEAQAMRAWCAAISSSMDGLANDANMLRALIQSGEESQELNQLVEFLTSTAEVVLQQLKSIRRRLPTDPNISNLGLDPEWWERSGAITQREAARAASCSAAGARASAAAAALCDPANPSIVDLRKLWAQSSDKHYQQDDLGPLQSMKKSLQTVCAEVAALAQFTQQQEYQINSTLKQETVRTSPIMERAQLVKKQLEETKTLTLKLENKEADLREIKKLLKAKQDEISEMQIRKELAEKKLSSATRDQELHVEKLSRKLEDAQNQLKRKEKEFEETMDHLQKDIDSLEIERGSLRDKLKLYCKKGDKSVSLQSQSGETSLPGSPKASQSERTITRPCAENAEGLHEELALLQGQLHKERSERINLEQRHCKEVLSRLVPLPQPAPSAITLNELKEKFAKFQFDWTMFLAKSGVCIFPDDPSKYEKALEDHKAKQKSIRKQLMDRLQEIQQEVRDEYLNRRPWRCVEADFAKFPTPELTRNINNSGSVDIGTLQYIIPPGQTAPNEGTVHVSRAQLGELQAAIERLGGSATLQYTPQYIEVDNTAA
ncbi:dynactin subunit 1 isoform X2 [Arctopsyche grandis]|uniref:dynactin subunit 1 isoform X2 n=1 Tax=Arctopsyche grandis TaxID=121162 RepID=UPI00406D99AB